MTAVLVDSCVLLDIFLEDPVWGGWSRSALVSATDSSPVVVSPVVYAEVSASFRQQAALDLALPRSEFRREPLPWTAAFQAGQAFAAYRRRGGARTAMLADFLIGAHASVAGYRLLTRDAKRFRASFPDLELIAPEA